jgi:nicotinate phosphoribosyltransferase
MGNHLGNDFENSPAPNMVIKLWSINGIPTVKLSDDAGKLIGDQDAVKVTKWECCGTPIEE